MKTTFAQVPKCATCAGVLPVIDSRLNQTLCADCRRKEEEAVALGFKDARAAKDHKAWLAEYGSPEYRATLAAQA